MILKYAIYMMHINFIKGLSILSTTVCYPHTYFTLAFLSSLREISVVDAVKRSPPIDIVLKLEPTIIAIGGKHVAACMNNKVNYLTILLVLVVIFFLQKMWLLILCCFVR